MLRIAMFSGPRNISTTMMRAFENRPDTRVHDEPFYAWYLTQSGAEHPMREAIIGSQPTQWRDVLAALAVPQPAYSVSFEKHIAFHFENAPSLTWLADAKVLHLIRDPRAMIASYVNKYDDVRPILDSFRVQRRILNYCEDIGAPCPVIDAADVLKNPPKMLRALCDSFAIPFDDAMLSWPAGRRQSDGVWGAHWYDAVEKSTGFKPHAERPIELPPALEALAGECADDYEFFHRRRLTV